MFFFMPIDGKWSKVDFEHDYSSRRSLPEIKFIAKDRSRWEKFHFGAMLPR